MKRPARRFCHLCGSSYRDPDAHPTVCSGCGNVYYENPRPTVGIVLFDDRGRALISERGIEPAKGKFNLPGGFVENKETLEEALARELQEELNLSPDDYTRPLYTQSFIADYSFSKDTYDITEAVFCAELINPQHIVSQDDSASIQFVAMNQLDTLLFDGQRHEFSLKIYPQIIRRAHRLLFDR